MKIENSFLSKYSFYQPCLFTQIEWVLPFPVHPLSLESSQEALSHSWETLGVLITISCKPCSAFWSGLCFKHVTQPYWGSWGLKKGKYRLRFLVPTNGSLSFARGSSSLECKMHLQWVTCAISNISLQMYFLHLEKCHWLQGELWPWFAEVISGLERGFFEGGAVGRLPPLDCVANLPTLFCRVQADLAVG